MRGPANRTQSRSCVSRQQMPVGQILGKTPKRSVMRTQWSNGLWDQEPEARGDMLLPATSHPGEPYDDLEELYGRMLGQWATELNHVTGIVGGFNSQQKHAGQDGVRFTMVPREKQVAAVRFLNDNAFATPTWALKPEILRRIEPSGALERVKTAQLRVLNVLLTAVVSIGWWSRKRSTARQRTGRLISWRMLGKASGASSRRQRLKLTPIVATCSGPILNSG